MKPGDVLKVKMELICYGVEVNEDTKEEKPILLVEFSDSEGKVFRYPWEGLRETVKKWIEVENEINTSKPSTIG